MFLYENISKEQDSSTQSLGRFQRPGLERERQLRSGGINNPLYSSSYSGVTAGTYNVSITDSLGCNITDSLIVTEPTPISNYFTGDSISCPFGNDGDFITSPEISQLFGELIGLWFADIWLKMDCPQKVHLIELGPGNGTLLSDLTRALSILPSFKNNIELHLVEASPKLIKIQKKNLNDFKNII